VDITVVVAGEGQVLETGRREGGKGGGRQGGCKSVEAKELVWDAE